MSAEVLAYARERDPRFKTVPDDELTLYIGDRAPEFLQDPDFQKVYEARKQQAANAADTARATSAPAIIKEAVDLPGWKKALTEGSREDWGRALDQANQGMDRIVSAPLEAVGNVGGAALNKVGDLLAGDVKAITGLTSLDPSGPVATGLQEGARTVPVIAGAMALQSMGVPAPVAFAIPPAAAAFEHTGDLSAAIQAGSVAAVIPGVMTAGKQASATILGKLVEKGALSAEAAVPQKVAEMLGGQGAVQVFLEGMNLPAYAAMNPEERRDAILRNVVANTAFMAMDVPGLIDGSPSVMQTGNRGLRAADALRRIQRDPEVLAGLQAVADAAVANPLREVFQDNPLTTRQAPLGEVPLPPKVEPKVETDPARRQEIKNSIQEGEMILKVGRNTAGKKMTPDQLEGVRRSVASSKAKLGPEPSPLADINWMDEQPAPQAVALEYAITGKPATFEVWRGEGKPKSAVYNFADSAIFGPGDYRAATKGQAAEYGDSVKQGEVTVRNPLVIRTDGQWAELVESAGWEFLNPFGLPRNEIKKLSDQLKAEIQRRGHDALVVRPVPRNQGDYSKTLWNLAGHDQIVVYGDPPPSSIDPASKSATRGPSAAGEGAETITGFNERIGSEMPAEREERPNPPRRRAPRTEQVFGAERPRDLIDEIQDAFGKVSLAEIRRLEPNFKPAGAARKLFAADSGHPADVVAEAMARSGFYKGDPARIGDFAYAVLEAASARKGNRKASAEANREIREQAKQHEAFQDKVIAGRRPKKEQQNVEQVSVSELVEGDRFTVQGQKFKVQEMEWDPDTESLVSVTLKDGPKFGVQRIEGSDAEVIHIDKESFVQKPGSRSTDFLSPEDMEGPPGADDPFSLESVTKEQLDAEEAARTQKAKTDAQREELARRAEAPLTGNSADVGQGALFNADADLFSGPAAQHSQAHGTKAQAYPGGPLGEAPVSPADNPGFSRFPMELPEAVRFARDLAGGVYPRLRDKMRLMGGRALGVFRHNDAAGKASIEIRRDIFDLPTSERQRLLEEARAYGKAVGKSETEINEITRERFEFLKREAFKENPLMALKVLWHEIGHWVDWVPDHIIGGRGNLFGRLASLKGYLRHTLPEGPDVPDRPITEAQRAKLKREAEAELREELGPIEEIVRTILVEEPEFRVTGVTPDDVKQLFGMDAREKMPELYRWFAEQPSEAKKEIVRAAMKGVVDARVAALGKREQIGTRKVERTVREKTGREPTREEIRERFQKMLREELARRRMIQLDQIKKEIEPMIAWWRGTDQMEEYFRPSAEMYAEAFSIFANNPGALAKRAPTYYRVLTNYLGRKPEVAKLYREIQDSIGAGTIMRDRVVDLRRSWREDDAQSMERAATKERIAPRDFLNNVLYHLDDRLGPVYQIARRAGDQGGALRQAAGNYRYRATEHERLLSRVNREVVEPLANAGVDREMLAEYMFHKHVTESRFVKDGDTGEIRMIGNPMGWAPKNSLERLAEMQSQLGPDGFARVEAAHRRFRAIYEDQVVDLIRRSGMASPELMKAIEDRTFYATFSKVKGDAAVDGIEQLLQDSFGADVTAKIYRQVGNLGEIKNPFTATVMKSLSLTSAAYRNIVKRETVRSMLEHDPSQIKAADVRWTGKRMEPRIVDQGKVGTIVYLDQGKVQAYYVPKAVADAIHGGPVVDNMLALGAMKAMGGLKALFTQLNYGFWPVAFARDAIAWQMQLPGWNSVEYAKRIGPAIKAASDAWGGRRANPLADEALRRQMLISRNDSRGVMSSVDNEFDLSVASYGLDPVKWGAAEKSGSTLVRAWNAYREFGQIAERAQKIAGMTYLDAKFPDMPEWQKQEMVRERAGSPDFLRRGASSSLIDFGMMFFNPWKEGVRSLLKTGRDNPFSFGAKALAAIVSPAVLQSMAVRGALGEDTKELYGSVSDYDLTNYLIVPLGWADRERSKAAYIRLPLWEPARLLHGAVFSSLTGRGQGILSHAGGQVPGINPLFTTSAMWWTYLVNGKNPYDSFRGREMLSPDVFAVGGQPAVEQLLRQTWNNVGGGIITQLQDRPIGEPDPGRVEAFLRLPLVSNLVGRWVKVSNRGVFDQDRKAAEVPSREASARREVVRSVVEKVMADPPQALTDSERAIMRNPDAMRYFYDLRLKTAQSQNS